MTRNLGTYTCARAPPPPPLLAARITQPGGGAYPRTHFAMKMLWPTTPARVTRGR
jgi:hypothetical protein